MMHAIIDSNFILKNICAVPESIACDPKGGLVPHCDKGAGDIFLEYCPMPPDGTEKARFIGPPNWRELLEEARNNNTAEPVLWEEAAEQIEIDKINLERARVGLSDAVDQYLDRFANSKRYKNIHATALYRGQGNPFKAEADAIGLYAGEVWAYVEQVEQDVIAGKRAIPTEVELLSELPKYTGP